MEERRKGRTDDPDRTRPFLLSSIQPCHSIPYAGDHRMLPRKLGVVMITVSDMNRSVAFYRDTLGLPLRFQSPEWTEFDTETVTLALHGGGAPRTGAPPAGPGPAGSVSTGWNVEDLDAVYSRL